MTKEKKEKIETQRSIMLVNLRKKYGLSLRKVAELMNLSKSRVHQIESGGENISDEYLEKYVRMLEIYAGADLSEKYLGPGIKREGIRQECKELIDHLNEDKLLLVRDILKNF